MVETLLFYTAVERFNKENNEAKRLAQAKEIFARFFDQSSDSPDTVTFTGELVRSVQDRIEAGDLDALFSEATVEVLILMSSNALLDFLESLHIPSLEECFSDARHFRRFRHFASLHGGLEEVELVEAIMKYECNESCCE